MKRQHTWPLLRGRCHLPVVAHDREDDDNDDDDDDDDHDDGDDNLYESKD